MLTGTILPVHPKPLPNEALSSWFARVAEANAVKQHSLAFLRMGAQKPPWSWTLDLEGRDWFLRSLCEITGTSFEAGEKTTLADYAGVVFPQSQKGTRRLWVLPTKTQRSRIMTDGIQFCPTCLSEGLHPYYRRQWRLAFFTFCPVHNTRLYEVCPSCDAPIAYHRRDCSVKVEAAKSIANCYNCGFDFRLSQALPLEALPLEVAAHYQNILMEFQTNSVSRFGSSFLSVLHQLCMVMVSTRNKGKLRNYVYTCSGINPIHIGSRMGPFYWGPHETRFHIITLSLWLLLDAADGIRGAWKAGAVRCASLMRDFPDAPNWFRSVVQEMNRQRVKLRDFRRTSFDKKGMG